MDGSNSVINTGEVLAFLKTLMAGQEGSLQVEAVESVAAEGAKPNIEQQTVALDNLDDLTTFIEDHHDWNLRLPNQGGVATFYHVTLTPNDPPADATLKDKDEHLRQERERLRRQIGACPLFPTFIIDTGASYQCVWETLAPVSAALAGTINQRLSAYFRAPVVGDHLHLPYTTYHPSFAEQRKGWAEGLIRVIEDDSGDAYAPEDFDVLTAGPPLDLAGVDTYTMAEKLTSQKVQMDQAYRYLMEGKGERPLWMVDRSPEGHDLDTAMTLKRLGCTPDETGLCVKNNDRGAVDRHGDLQYITEVVRKAFTPPFTLAPGASSQGFAAPFLDAIWDDNLAIDWLISGVLENKVIAEIWGPSGVYKSFLALDMAVAIASGQDWHGNKIKHQGEVLYICGEGRRNITRRLRAVCQERDLGRDTKIRITNMPVMLAREDQAKWLLSEIKDMRAAPVLIIVDTLSRNYGANENQTEDMNGFIDNIALLSRELGATVLIIHHCGYDTTHARGAYTLYAGLDAVYKVEADKKVRNKHAVKLTNEKMKDAPEGDIWGFLAKVVTIKDEEGNPLMDDGRPIDSVVLQDGASLHIRDKAEFFRDHPRLKEGKRAERLPEVLRYAHFNPDATDNAVALAVAPDTKSRNWAGELREVMVAEGLIEGEHYQLTEAGKEAAIIFDALVELATTLGAQPERPFPPPKVGTVH